MVVIPFHPDWEVSFEWLVGQRDSHDPVFWDVLADPRRADHILHLLAEYEDLTGESLFWAEHLLPSLTTPAFTRAFHEALFEEISVAGLLDEKKKAVEIYCRIGDERRRRMRAVLARRDFTFTQIIFLSDLERIAADGRLPTQTPPPDDSNPDPGFTRPRRALPAPSSAAGSPLTRPRRSLPQFNAGQGGAATPTPERPETLAAQMKALREGRRRAVMVTPGEKSPAIPTGYVKTETDKGVFIHKPSVVSREEVRDLVAANREGELLGHVEPKSAKTTQTVVARGPQGEELQASQASPRNVPAQAAELKRQFPDARVESGGAEKAAEVIKGRRGLPEVPGAAASSASQPWARLRRQTVVHPGGPEVVSVAELERRGKLGYEEALEKIKTAGAKEVEELKQQGRDLAREQSALQREITNRLKEPRPFDPEDPYDSDLLKRAEGAGVHFDVKGFGDTKNPVTMEVEDPTDPNHVRKTRRQYNRATGLWEDINDSSGAPVVTKRVQPVDDKGMTPAQERTAKDREQAHADLQKQRALSNKFRTIQILQADKRLSLAEAAQSNRFSEQERKELKDANKLAADGERYARAAQDLESKTTYRDPETGEVRESKRYAAKRDEYLARAAALRSQFINTYGYLFAPSDGAPPQMTLNQFRGLFPNAAGSPAVEASRLGINLTDTDQGVRGPASPMPRRGAPRRELPRPPSPRPRVSRAKFRAKYLEFKDRPDSEVDSAIISSGGQPIP